MTAGTYRIESCEELERVVFFPDGLVGPEAVEIIDHPAIERMGRQRRTVAHHQQFPAGARYGDIHSTDILQKTDLGPWVGSYERDDHRFFLSSLEAIHAVDLQARHGQLFAKETHLGGIGGDDGDVACRHAAVQESMNLSAYKSRFMPIQSALTLWFDLLVKACSGCIDKLDWPL